ncbi:MAG: 2Fe-2S iron-sulfur cluster-binding protein [bacterium]
MNLTIDNREIHLGKPVTILDAARKNCIDIPTLCAHPELTPYGGCRLCVVEIEGRNGYPTSCTTMAEEGMIVRTNTKVLQEMRRELIQLILSEHPAACLMCDDIEGCKVFQETIRKVGITTGCRWCPKDNDCELQRIVDEFGIDELTLPGLYRGIPLEKFDPFFDRDYNLCIYCGRCVRICNEHRKSAVLSLKQRGKLTTIGPSFDASHVEADCEFCGACVSVCPTGAMSEKSRKWWGVPEKYAPSACPLCSLNCDLQALTVKDKIVGTVPPGKPHESGGDLCVKGRFCLSELVNRTERILEPEYRYPEGYGIVTWDFALEKTREILEGTRPGRSALFISPGLTLEEIHAAKFFGETILRTSEFTASCLDEHFLSYLHLAKQSVELEKVNTADAVLSLFLNGNYNFAPLTLAIKSAADRGIPYYQVGWIGDTTSRFARHRFFPVPGKEEEYFDQMILCMKNGQCSLPAIKELSGTLKKAKRSVIVVGPQIISLTDCCGLLTKIQQVARLTNSSLFIPTPYGNLNGLLSLINLKPVEEIYRKIKEGKINTLYLIGDAPFTETLDVKHMIYQDAFPVPPGLYPDVLLPAALWGEAGGSYLSTGGKIKKIKPVALPHGYARSHNEILSALTGTRKTKSAGFSSREMKQWISGPAKIPRYSGKTVTAVTKKASPSGKKYPYILIQEKNPHVYNNSNLGRDISAFGELIQPGNVILNPFDAKKLGVKQGDPIQLLTPGKKMSSTSVIRKNIPRGTIYLTTTNGKLKFESNPCYINIMRDHV